MGRPGEVGRRNTFVSRLLLNDNCASLDVGLDLQAARNGLVMVWIAIPTFTTGVASFDARFDFHTYSFWMLKLYSVALSSASRMTAVHLYRRE